MPRLPVLAIACAALLLSGPAAMAQIMTAAPNWDTAPDKLTADEIKAAFGGKHREEGQDAAGNFWTIVAAADGALRFTAGTYTDTGRLAVRGASVCFSWTKAWRGEERCFRYAHHGQELASYGPNGGLNSVVRISR